MRPCTSEEIIGIVETPYFCECVLSHCFSMIAKTTIHLSVGMKKSETRVKQDPLVPQQVNKFAMLGKVSTTSHLHFGE